MRRFVLATTMLGTLGVCSLEVDDAGASSDAAVRDAASDVMTNGRLDAREIQGVVRASFGRFKSCYIAALRRTPGTGGRVNTRFVIDRTGHVSGASAQADSTLPDPIARQCIVDGFSTLVFPAPEGGIVTIIYPLIFSPGDESADVTDAGPG